MVWYPKPEGPVLATMAIFQIPDVSVSKSDVLVFTD
jgi:hypothetical protein